MIEKITSIPGQAIRYGKTGAATGRKSALTDRAGSRTAKPPYTVQAIT